MHQLGAFLANTVEVRGGGFPDKLHVRVVPAQGQVPFYLPSKMLLYYVFLGGICLGLLN